MKNKYVWGVIALLVIVMTVFFGLRGYKESQAVKRQIAVLEAENKRLAAEMAAKVKEIAALQKAHDVKIKEAGRNAANKIAALSDDALLDAVNDLIDGARGRNAERRWQF